MFYDRKERTSVYPKFSLFESAVVPVISDKGEFTVPINDKFTNIRREPSPVGFFDKHKGCSQFNGYGVSRQFSRFPRF